MDAATPAAGDPPEPRGRKRSLSPEPTDDAPAPKRVQDEEAVVAAEDTRPPLLRLPAELLTQIGDDLATDDLHATMEDLTPLRRVNRQLRDHFTAELYKHVIPQDGFPALPAPPGDDDFAMAGPGSRSASPVSDRSGSPGADVVPPGPASAANRIRAIGPILHRQPPERLSALVAQIERIDHPPHQVEAIAATGRTSPRSPRMTGRACSGMRWRRCTTWSCRTFPLTTPSGVPLRASSNEAGRICGPQTTRRSPALWRSIPQATRTTQGPRIDR